MPTTGRTSHGSVVGDVLGAVLTGGGSTRMGQDKALLVIDGEPMARRAGRVLAEAGATRVVAVGGDAGALRAVGMEVVADPHQGHGPLAGIAAALHAAADADLVMILACDLVAATPGGVRTVIDALTGAIGTEVAVPVVDGRPEPLHTAWRPSAAAVVDDALEAGELAVHPLFDRIATVRVDGLDPAWFVNVNTPADLGHT